MTINALLLHTESKPSEQLEKYINVHFPEVKLNKIYLEQSVKLAQLEKWEPQLLFVDCDELNQNSDQLLRYLNQKRLEFIVLSNREQAAYQAHKFGAAGFVLKPIDSNELVSVVQRAREKIILRGDSKGRGNLIQQINYQLSRENLIGIPTMEGFDFIRINDVIHCKGLQRCTQIVSTKKKVIISSYNLGKFKRLLEPYGFFSPHRSHLINLNYIKKYNKEGFIVLQNDTAIPVAKRKKAEFLKLILHI